MLQESYPPDEASLSMYIPALTLYVQNQWILYHSIGYELYIHISWAVHAITQQNTPYWYMHTICRIYVQRMYMSVHCTYAYEPCMSHVHSCYAQCCTDFSKNKSWHRSRFEPMILCILTSHQRTGLCTPRALHVHTVHTALCALRAHTGRATPFDQNCVFECFSC